MAANGPFVRYMGRMLRCGGQMMDRFGTILQHPNGYVEKLVPSTRVVAFRGRSLQHGLQAFVASTASIIGDVSLGEMASAWYGATLKADKDSIKIGRNSAVLDNAVVSTPKGPVVIGEDVVVLPGAIVNSAKIGDGTMVGMGAIIMPGAVIGNDCFIDGGAVVPAGTVVPSGQLWTGRPARHLRNLTVEEMSYMRSAAVEYGTLSQKHFEEGAKGVEEVEADRELLLTKLDMGLAAEATIPKPDDDVIEYYKLTALPEDAGLLRDKEYNLEAEAALREEEELAADVAENERYAALERMRRVGAALAQLAAASPGSAKAALVVSDLAALDPAGAALLRDFVGKVGAAAEAGDEARKSQLTQVIRTFDPVQRGLEDEEATAAAEETFAAVVAHAKAGALAAAPAATAAAATAAAAPSRSATVELR